LPIAEKYSTEHWSKCVKTSLNEVAMFSFFSLGNSFLEFKNE